MKGIGRAFAAFLFLWSAGVSATSGPEWLRAIRNTAGEFCCGPRDCFQIEARAVRYDPATGAYVVDWQGVFHPIPERELLPGRFGEWWVCERPDHTIRCLLGPKNAS